jgi:type II secretory ATPase GspE/PulE/Tfp pilus assembly ATPase PilB-like protein
MNDDRASGQLQLNTEQIYRLIDSMLSFEACLYHQVLPVAVEGQHLILGMVNPDDTAAIEYVGRIIAYLKYTLVPHAMEAEDHRQIMSAYLNRPKDNDSASDKVRSIATGSPGASTAAKPTAEKPTGLSANDKPTLILADERENIAELKASQSQKQQPTPSSLGGIKAPQPQQPAAKPSGLGGIKAPQPQQPTPSGLGGIKAPQPQQKSSAQAAASGLPAIKLQASHSSSSIEFLKTLPPKKLIQELLGRVLEKGIGRLYFERKSPQQGRIVCSQDGNLQCVLTDVPAKLFQAAIEQLKELTHMPIAPVKEAKQVEIERFYHNERVLLRLRVMPGSDGEQATLQVLRGEALTFYQQQQLDTLSRDAMAIANQLQKKLRQLQERANLDAEEHRERYESLLALNQIIENVDRQLEKLKNLPA